MKECTIRVPYLACFTLQKLLTLSAAPAVKRSIFISPAGAFDERLGVLLFPHPTSSPSQRVLDAVNAYYRRKKQKAKK